MCVHVHVHVCVPPGRQAVALVREFLEFFELDFTTAVFDPETNAVRY